MVIKIKNKYFFSKKNIYGLALGLVLAFIVLNIDKKLWYPIELETVNARNTFNIEKNKLSTEDVILILFDDRSKFLLRRKGMPVTDFESKERGLINKAINKLEEVGVKAIGLNLNLRSPSVKSKDDELVRTIRENNNIVIADSIYFPPQNRNKILRGSKNVGFGELFASYDKVVHSINLFDQPTRNIQSFSYSLYNLISGDGLPEDVLRKNEMYLRYPSSRIKRFSFIDLLNDEIDKKQLENKIIIVGVGLKSKLIKDGLFNPYGESVSSSEVQAVGVLNLLSRKYLVNHSLIKYPLLLFLLSVIFGGLFTSMKAIKGLILMTILFIVTLVFGQVSYSQFNSLFEIVPVIFILISNYVIGSLVFLQLNLEEQNEALSMTLGELNDRVNEVKEVRKQLANKTEDERKRIARELHDDSLARITDLKRFIESIKTSDQNKKSEKLEECISTLDTVTKEIRRIINALRPSMLDNALGFVFAIENLLDDLSKRSEGKIETKLLTNIENLKLEPSLEIHVYRIIQEALNNAFKHSNCNRVEVQITKQLENLQILVSDNGVGLENLNSKNGGGFGLIDMKERADLIGASINYINKPAGGGTAVEMNLPLENS